MSEADDRQRQLQTRWASEGLTGLPAPWSKVMAPHVGGIHSVGLDPDGKFLLTISHSGRGVVDCETGEMVARDYADNDEDWLDYNKLTALGIGPLGAETLRIAGSFAGGGTPRTTSDQWTVDTLALCWDKTVVWATGPDDRDGFFGGGLDGMGRRADHNPRTFYKLWDWDRPFACGFSESGKTLVVACSNDIVIWRRA